MQDEELFRHGNTAVRRLTLNPGEAMARQRDPHHRGWEQPSSRVHRAINVGQKTYQQITIFLLDRPDAIPQPHEE